MALSTAKGSAGALVKRQYGPKAPAKPIRPAKVVKQKGK
jgi:hypothetical protein